MTKQSHYREPHDNEVDRDVQYEVCDEEQLEGVVDELREVLNDFPFGIVAKYEVARYIYRNAYES